MYKLCWVPTDWNTPEQYRGIPHAATFESLDRLIKVMRNCTYSGEWVEDSKGNRININLKEICL
ncbi:hypothetical protein V1503_20200 [Bacillus sp. SCS-151]|uniref:hypothetical protein n=1 Tax=Nanhaiella sioensis TaxID=3115293 RepID=UPI0039798B99